MLALQIDWAGSGARLEPGIAQSLGLFAGKPAAYHRDGELACALLDGSRQVPGPHWQPAKLPDGGWLLFTGAIDNHHEIAREVGLDPESRADAVYAAALARFAGRVDSVCNGCYAAVSIDGARGKIRLARSPITAPPLYYCWSEAGVTTASVPRVLGAAGHALKIDRIRFALNFSYDFTEHERGWYEGTWMVPLGATVTLTRAARRTRTFYDPLDFTVGEIGDDEAREEAERLLSEAGARITRASRKPAVMLSGGLDSPLSALAVLRGRPELARVPTLTFRPDRDWDGRNLVGQIGDESPAALAFAAMHERLDPHVFTNDGLAIDHFDREMFAATGIASSALPNWFPFHALWRGALEQGCDAIYSGWWGNFGLTLDGRWAFGEYLRHGKWSELARLVAGFEDDRSLARRWLALVAMPQLPASWRVAIRRVIHGPGARDTAHSSPLRREHVGGASRAIWENPADTRRAYLGSIYAHGDGYLGDMTQGFEQIYGIASRDLLSYRPLVEFCTRLPTTQFARNGQRRWLARRIGAGHIPESTLADQRYGFQHADWELRLLRERPRLQAAIARWRGVPQIADVLDLDRIERHLASIGTHRFERPEEEGPVRALITRGIAAAHFIGYVGGRNDV